MKAIFLALTAATAACVHTETDTPPAATAPGNEACDATAARSLVGKKASDALLEEGKRLSGAEVARFLRPGQVVTMEYRADRLNLRLDEADIVLSVDCG